LEVAKFGGDFKHLRTGFRHFIANLMSPDWNLIKIASSNNSENAMQTWTPVIITHTAIAVAAMGLGAFTFTRVKGSPIHKLSGRIWVGLMLAVALTSFWIRSTGTFSWIHGLSIGAVVSLAIAVMLARKKKIRAHQGWMLGIYFGALVLTGIFTLMPGRLIGRMLWA
jgi:uncharacterized membrane protein